MLLTAWIRLPNMRKIHVTPPVAVRFLSFQLHHYDSTRTLCTWNGRQLQANLYDELHLYCENSVFRTPSDMTEANIVKLRVKTQNISVACKYVKVEFSLLGSGSTWTESSSKL